MKTYTESQMRIEVATLYVAWFGRAADEAGLNWHMDQMNGVYTSETLDARSAQFGEAAVQSNLQGYGTVMTTTGTVDAEDRVAFVEKVYLNVLNRGDGQVMGVSDAEIGYWTGFLSAGGTAAEVMNQMIQAFLHNDPNATGNTNPTQSRLDLQLFENKIKVSMELAKQGVNFVADAGLTGSVANQDIVTKATAIIDLVTTDTSSVSTAIQAVAIEHRMDNGRSFTLDDLDTPASKVIDIAVYGQSNSAGYGAGEYNTVNNVTYVDSHNGQERFYRDSAGAGNGNEPWINEDGYYHTVGNDGSVWGHLGDLIIDTSTTIDQVNFTTNGIGSQTVKQLSQSVANGGQVGMNGLAAIDNFKAAITAQQPDIVIYTQGEGDNLIETSSYSYTNDLIDLIRTVGLTNTTPADTIKMYVSTTSYVDYRSYDGFPSTVVGLDPNIVNAQQAAIDFVQYNPNLFTGVEVFRGANTDQYLGDYRSFDGTHFTQEALELIATDWANLLDLSI